jgi:hypothetical protein
MQFFRAIGVGITALPVQAASFSRTANLVLTALPGLRAQLETVTPVTSLRPHAPLGTTATVAPIPPAHLVSALPVRLLRHPATRATTVRLEAQARQYARLDLSAPHRRPRLPTARRATSARKVHRRELSISVLQVTSVLCALLPTRRTCAPPDTSVRREPHPGQKMHVVSDIHALLGLRRARPPARLVTTVQGVQEGDSAPLAISVPWGQEVVPPTRARRDTSAQCNPATARPTCVSLEVTAPLGAQLPASVFLGRFVPQEAHPLVRVLLALTAPLRTLLLLLCVSTTHTALRDPRPI